MAALLRALHFNSWRRLFVLLLLVLFLVVIATKMIEIEAKGVHTATVIMMHGLGDTGAGWSFLPTYYNSSSVKSATRKLGHIKWLFPNAPVAPVTLNAGMHMSSWFDIRSLDALDNSTSEDRAGMLESSHKISKLVENEIKAGINPNRIVVGGFSQGGAIAILTGLTYPERLGGLVVLSSFLPLRNEISSMIVPENSHIPVFQGHGTADPVVAFQYGENTGKALEDIGLNMTFKKYLGMGHAAAMEELEDLGDWFENVIPEK